MFENLIFVNYGKYLLNHGLNILWYVSWYILDAGTLYYLWKDYRKYVKWFLYFLSNLQFQGLTSTWIKLFSTASTFTMSTAVEVGPMGLARNIQAWFTLREKQIQLESPFDLLDSATSWFLQASIFSEAFGSV